MVVRFCGSLPRLCHELLGVSLRLMVSPSPVYIFFGGMVQIFGAVGEWIIGNTFSSALFFTYGRLRRDSTRMASR